MNQIHKKLESFVFSNNSFSTVEEAKEIADGFKEATKELEESVYQKLPPDYTYTARPYTFPILKKDVVPFYRGDGEDGQTQIPRYVAQNEDLLDGMYDGVILNGEAYSKNHPGVVKAKDTERYILKENGYDVLTGGFCENKGSLIELPQYDGYAFEDDVTKSYDTQRLELKDRLYHWKGSDGEGRFYKYQQLSPDARVQRIYFEEAQFPGPDDIKETRVGIELEYSKAIQATRNALVNENFRNKWNSVRDGSIPDDGTEFVSVPFKLDEFDQISNFIRFCEQHSARINKRCGFHVHVGSPDLDFVSLTSVVLLCENIQKDLFKLVPDHRKNNEYCRSLDKSFRGFKNVKSNKDEKEVANIFYEDAGTDYDHRHKQSKYAVNSKRHYWVSIDRFFRFREESHKRTVEFRMHHATHDPEEFMQFVYLCYYIVQFCIDNTLQEARNATLEDVVNWIPNKFNQRRVEDLLTTKKVFEKV